MNSKEKSSSENVNETDTEKNLEENVDAAVNTDAADAENAPAIDAKNAAAESVETAGESAETSVDNNDEKVDEASGETPAVSADAGGEAAAVEEKVTVLDLIKGFFRKTGKFMGDCGIPDGLLARCIGLYFFFSGINIAHARKDFIDPVNAWKDYVEDVNFGTVLLRCIIGFIFITAIHYGFSLYKVKHANVIDSVVLFTGTTFFACQSLWKSENYYLTLGTLALCLVFIIYSVGRVDHKLLAKIPAYVSVPLVLLLTVGVGIFLGVTTVCKHRMFETNCFDTGIFAQMYHSLGKHFTAVTTCERNHFLTHFKVHASYIFYILAPLNKLFPSEDTLFIVQSVFTVSGIIPLILIARRHNFKGLSLIAACLVYTFYSGLIAPNYYEFHENSFLPTILMWLLYAADSRKIILLYIMTVLTCIVKEDAPLYVMCIGMFLLFDEKKFSKRINGLIITVLSGIYFVFITNWLKEHGDGDMMMSTRFGNLTIDQDKGFVGVFFNILKDPSYFFSLFIQEQTIMFFIQMMVPLLFLPFMTKKIHRFLLILPFVIMNLVIGSGYGYAATMGFQYTFGPAALLIYMSLINCADISDKRRVVILSAAMYSSFLTSFAMYSVKLNYYDNYKKSKAHYDTMDECLDSVPKDASVACNGWYVPHMGDREEIYLLDNYITRDPADNSIITGLKDADKCDYFVLSYGDSNIAPYLIQAGYSLYADCEGRILIYKSVYVQ